MSKLIALLALLTLITLTGLGNFWFTYGIWPKSWWFFALFAFLQLILTALMGAVTSEK